jgi:serine/threonine-protein kinase
MAAVTIESKIPVGALLVGKYRVTREIGRGGMAAVYEAEHMALGKKIAVKVLAAELAASTVVIERFFREARAAASVRSPHIVDVYDSGRLEDGRPFIAMEMLEGESLYERMARIRIIAVRSTVQIIAHCCKGLTKAHAAGIIHRDLKPENIFLVTGEEGEEIAKILDFGLAKFYAPVATDEKASRLTREGAVFGTPAYMSPEQVKDAKEVDARTDLWSAGVLLYEMLTGRSPFPAQNEYARLLAVVNEPAVPIDMEDERLTPLSPFFVRALAKRREDRFASAGEMLQALNALLEPSSANGTSPVAPGILAVANQKRDLAQRRLHATLHELAEGSSMLLDKERRVALWAVAALIFVAFLAGLTFGFALARSTM